MGGYASATTYDPNGTMRQLTSAPGPGAVPGAMGPDPNQINALLAYKTKLAADQQAQENDRQNRALSLQEWMARNAQTERDQSRMDARRATDAARGQVRHGAPVFSKTIGGLGVTPGTIRLNQWEPGAAFSGYAEDLGTGPANAVMSPVAGAAQAGSRAVAANEWDTYNKETAARRRAPAYGTAR